MFIQTAQPLLWGRHSVLGLIPVFSIRVHSLISKFTIRSFDIYTNAKITQAQFNSFNPGLDCSLLQLGMCLAVDEAGNSYLNELTGQRVCVSAGTLPSLSPTPQPNGTCAEYTAVSGDSCSGEERGLTCA